MKILFLEDDPIIGNNVLDFLSEFYEIKHCFNSSDAMKYADDVDYDLYIFDINVPGISGVELLKDLREFNDTTPAIFITAYQEIKYLKDAFKVGVNDFLRKPFDLEELQVRVENIKRQFNLDEAISISQSISFNTVLNKLIIDNKEIFISAKESKILHYLISNKNHVVSTDELLQNLWDYDEMPSSATIRTYIKKLRQLLGKEHILNIRGEGYRCQ